MSATAKRLQAYRLHNNQPISRVGFGNSALQLKLDGQSQKDSVKTALNAALGGSGMKLRISSTS
eukprot:579545-Amphidinium_carterae.2